MARGIFGWAVSESRSRLGEEGDSGVSPGGS